MPIFARWKWQEKTKSYLLIFRFIDDFSKPNLRIKTHPKSHKADLIRVADVTWAPTHIELGLLSELLGYANIINGFSETTKRELRKKLEVTYKDRDTKYINEETLFQLDQIPDKPYTIYVNFKEWELWIYVCPEYIEHLRKLLKPYIKTS